MVIICYFIIVPRIESDDNAKVSRAWRCRESFRVSPQISGIRTDAVLSAPAWLGGCAACEYTVRISIPEGTAAYH